MAELRLRISIGLYPYAELSMVGCEIKNKNKNKAALLNISKNQFSFGALVLLLFCFGVVQWMCMCVHCSLIASSSSLVRRVAHSLLLVEPHRTCRAGSFGSLPRNQLNYLH